ncbi:MAG: hypothetical protein ACXVCY_14785 [Pseudobdellovibrionaceae bacterium]
MNTRKIVEIRPEGTGIFINYLKFLSKEREWEWIFENHPGLEEDILKNASAVKIDTSLSSQIISQLKVLSSRVRDLGVLDSLFQENGVWYPRLLLYDALRLVLVNEASDLDVRAPAFVVGSTEEARVAVATLADIGISDFYMVGDTERLNHEKEVLLRSLFGIRIQILPPEDLTIQALSAGVMINTMDLTNQKSLLMDLSYFNYMKQNGYVLDLNISGKHQLLLEEAEKADLKAVTPRTVAEVYTQLWFERLNIKFDAIAESWSRFLKEISSSV